MNPKKNEGERVQRPLELLILNSIAMILSGLALGWMIGMSTSPIIKEVIVSLLAVLTTIMGLIAGYSTISRVNNGVLDFTNATSDVVIEQDPKTETDAKLKILAKKDPQRPNPIAYLNGVNLLPIGLFMLCMAIGSGLGVYTRVNYLLVDLPKEKKMRVLEMRADKIMMDTTSNKIELYKETVEWP